MPFASKASRERHTSNTVKWFGRLVLLHDLEAHVARRRAARLPQRFQRDDGVVLLRRDDVDVGHAVDGTGRKLIGPTESELWKRSSAGALRKLASFSRNSFVPAAAIGHPTRPCLSRRRDDELSRPDGAPHDHRAQVPGRGAARVAVGFQERGSFVPGGRLAST